MNKLLTNKFQFWMVRQNARIEKLASIKSTYFNFFKPKLAASNLWVKSKKISVIVVGMLILEPIVHLDVSNNLSAQTFYKNEYEVLQNAVKKGNIETVRRLIESKAVDLDEAQSTKKYFFLIDAVTNGNIEIIEYLIAHGVDINEKNSYGITPLSRAVNYSESEAIKILIRNGVNVNTKDDEGQTVIFDARDRSVVNQLIEAGARLDIFNNNDMTPIMEAASRGFVRNYEDALWYNKKLLNQQNSLGMTVLMIVSSWEFGDHDIPNLLMWGADPTIRDKKGMTAKDYAKKYGWINNVAILENSGIKDDSFVDFNIYSDLDNQLLGARSDIDKIKELLSKGANINARDKDGETILLKAVNSYDLWNNYDLVKLLLQRGAYIDVQNQNGITPLMWAIYKKAFDIAILLLNSGADVTVKSWNYGLMQSGGGMTALHFLAMHDYLSKIIDVLIDNGAKINAGEEYGGTTPLMLAAKTNNIEFAKRLIKEDGTIVETTNNWGETPLSFAVSEKNPDMVEFLLELGANPNHRKKLGTPVLLALNNIRDESGMRIFRALIERGASVDWKGKEGEEVLHRAAADGFSEGVKYCLGKGTNANTTGTYSSGIPALTLASESGSLESVKLLVNNGADINRQSYDGSTSLIIATQEGHIEIVKYLLENNADITLKTSNGKTAFDFAKENEKKEITKLFGIIQNKQK
ncbi:MAG: ankyrin repeat domain-containing protein [Bacteroidales bacterium]|nr:ankyrin repeat domain-containing protein [Bacteroidales bacterium]